MAASKTKKIKTLEIQLEFDLTSAVSVALETFSEPGRKPKMEPFAKNVNGVVLVSLLLTLT